MKNLRFAILLLIAHCSFSQEFINPLEHPLVGQNAPSFSAKTLDNNEFTLEKHKGKTILMDFWSLNCSACFKELPELNELVKRYAEEDFVLISIMDNSREELSKRLSISENGYTLNKPVFGNDEIAFQVIPDGREIMNQYLQQIAFPQHFIIDENGKIQLFFYGYAPKRGIPDEVTTMEILIEKLNHLLSASR